MNLADLDLFKEVLTGGAHDESAWQALDTGPILASSSRLKHRLARCTARWLRRRFGLVLMRPLPFDRATRNAGLDWPLTGYSMAGRALLDHLQRCVETVLAERVPGDFIETGVWRGGACMLMQALLDMRNVSDRAVWLADSFAGLPPPVYEGDGWDLSNCAYLAVSEAQVRRNFARFGLLNERVKFLPGWFQETLPSAPIDRLAILRLDGDLHSSTQCVLDNLYDRVSPGGFVIVDDYHAWPGCRRATDEFLAARDEAPVLEEIDGTAVCWRRACDARI